MKPDDFQKIQEMIDSSIGMELWQVILIVIISLISGYLGSYLKEKGKNVYRALNSSLVALRELETT
ncbi:MAG: hypothetical protein LAT53_10615 [Idiomarina sp.]|nr:hypothetical protein [Idiomarina sp.]